VHGEDGVTLWTGAAGGGLMQLRRVAEKQCEIAVWQLSWSTGASKAEAYHCVQREGRSDRISWLAIWKSTEPGDSEQWDIEECWTHPDFQPASHSQGQRRSESGVHVSSHRSGSTPARRWLLGWPDEAGWRA
jgi:hypothetical protein